MRTSRHLSQTIGEELLTWNKVKLSKRTRRPSPHVDTDCETLLRHNLERQWPNICLTCQDILTVGVNWLPVKELPEMITTSDLKIYCGRFMKRKDDECVWCKFPSTPTSLLIVYSCMTDVGTSRQENQKMEGGDIYEESRHSSCKTTKGHEKKTFKLCGKFSFWYQTSNQTWEATKCKSLRSSQATRFCTTTKRREKISVCKFCIYQCHLLLWENHF